MPAYGAMGSEQRLIRFFGMVQGVGFRFTTIRVAAGYAVAGYVRNLPDGSVECVAEGESDQIDAFVADLSRRMGSYIRRQSQQTAPYTGEFESFDVRF
jgi:acylphosphatase